MRSINSELDRWIVAQRGPRADVDASRPYLYFVEDERSHAGEIVPIATIFLTNRECPWKCLMCDLWKNTLAQSVQPGMISGQIDYALERLPPARQLKLYNSGSFFDRGAIPLEDYGAIAARARAFEHLIVESHPALIGDAFVRFRDLLSGSFEVAMGLETVHPEVLPRLNKRMTLEQFANAAGMLRRHRTKVRAFVLVKPPFMDEADAVEWAARSVDFAFDCGVSVVTLIPTRAGNGAMDALAFRRPALATVEEAFEYGVGLNKGRVFVDLWDMAQRDECPECFGARVERLRGMNRTQTATGRVECGACG